MARAFVDVLGDLSRGKTHDELTTRLAEVVMAVMETEKVGSLTLIIKVKPNGDGSVFLIDDIKTKVPEPTRSDTLFFATAGGDLVRNSPDENDRGPRAVHVGPRLPQNRAQEG